MQDEAVLVRNDRKKVVLFPEIVIRDGVLFQQRLKKIKKET